MENVNFSEKMYLDCRKKTVVRVHFLMVKTPSVVGKWKKTLG